MKLFEKRIWLSSPTMHSDELEYIKSAYQANWITTEGENISEIENIVCEK